MNLNWLFFFMQFWKKAFLLVFHIKRLGSLFTHVSTGHRCYTIPVYLQGGICNSEGSGCEVDLTRRVVCLSGYWTREITNTGQNIQRYFIRWKPVLFFTFHIPLYHIYLIWGPALQKENWGGKVLWTSKGITVLKDKKNLHVLVKKLCQLWPDSKNWQLSFLEPLSDPKNVDHWHLSIAAVSGTHCMAVTFVY